MIELSSIENIYYVLPLVGFIVGLLGSMLGGGGGFVFLPVLILIVGIDPKTAVVTSLVASLPVSIIGAIGHYKEKNINIKVAIMFAIAGLFGAVAGSLITNAISSSMLKISFGIYSILMALNIAYTTRIKQKDVQSKQETKKILQKVKGAFFGFFAGIISGSFGTSGTAPVLSGLFSLRIPLKTVIGTSLLIISANTVFAIGTHVIMQNIDLTPVVFLTIGSVLGAIIGPKVLAKKDTTKSENTVRYVYASVVFTIGGLMILK